MNVTFEFQLHTNLQSRETESGTQKIKFILHFTVYSSMNLNKLCLLYKINETDSDTYL